MATDKLVVLTTIDKENLAIKIADALVDRRLAACVNIISAGMSIYRWKEKVCRDREFKLFIKTQAHLFNEVRDTIREFHTYDLPEVIALPIEVGEEKVLKWYEETTKPRS
jgi:periplasmic divalent cation tolerance protein